MYSKKYVAQLVLEDRGTGAVPQLGTDLCPTVTLLRDKLILWIQHLKNIL